VDQEVHTLRTDLVGGVQWLTDGENIQIEATLPERHGSLVVSTPPPAADAAAARREADPGGDPD
jgi:hypothetical protein